MNYKRVILKLSGETLQPESKKGCFDPDRVDKVANMLKTVHDHGAQLGIVIGGGTDATRANWFSPWASIWWLVTGRTLDGRGERLAEHCLSRTQAIAAFTRDAAWFTGEQDRRGRIAPGYDADLCVPSADPFGCADDALRDIRSDLTVLAGRITHQSSARPVTSAQLQETT